MILFVSVTQVLLVVGLLVGLSSFACVNVASFSTHHQLLHHRRVARVAPFSSLAKRRTSHFGSQGLIQNGRISLSLLSSSSLSSGKDSDSDSNDPTNAESVLSKAPSFNGKTVFPMKVFMNGLKGHEVAAVFAVMNKKYNRKVNIEGWDCVQHISITKDLYATLESLQGEYSNEQVAYVRALSFVYPQKSAMEEVAMKWKAVVDDGYGGMHAWNTDSNADADADAVINNNADASVSSEKELLVQLMKDTAVYDDDDDDDEFEFDDDDDIETLSSTLVKETLEVARNDNKSDSNDASNGIISPFDDSNSNVNASDDDNTDSDSSNSGSARADIKMDENGNMEFNSVNVNLVLDEIRPYLISDGGNVSVVKIDVETKNVYLKLEGACGSCASSTVTMSMGITRVLKENFIDLGEVVQVEDDDGSSNGTGNSNSNSNELSMDAVMSELNRIGPAITAMGGVVEVINVDPIGVVELKFRGSTKIQQGLELALRDVPLVKHVKFVQ